MKKNRLQLLEIGRITSVTTYLLHIETFTDLLFFNKRYT